MVTQGKRILVVDDEPLIVSLLTLALEAEGYQVEVAVNGRDALDRVQQQAPDAILLDVMMPVLDGWHFIAELRATPATRQIPIIVLSAAYDTANHPALGSLVFLPKPFDVNMLLILLDDALSNQETLA
ncbi:MAG: response regulator [Chloroflexota bacterium]